MTMDAGSSNATKEDMARIEARIGVLGTKIDILMVLNAGLLIAIIVDRLAG